MHQPTEMRQRADLRDYLAAERTFLAWIRTGLALMGFGFVVARFGLFLQQLRLFDHAPSASSYGVSLWFGTALIAVGVVVNLSSAWRHVRLVRELDQGEPACSRSLTQAVAIAIFLALVGLAMAIYLVSVRGSANLYSENRQEVSMALATNKGIIDKPSSHSAEQTVRADSGETQEYSAIQGRHPVCFGRPQRRSGEGGAEDASYQTADLRQSQSRNASDAGRSQHRHRLTTQGFGLGRYPGESLGFLQQPGLLKGTARSATGAAAKYRRCRNVGSQGRRVAPATLGRYTRK